MYHYGKINCPQFPYLVNKMLMLNQWNFIIDLNITLNSNIVSSKYNQISPNLSAMSIRMHGKRKENLYFYTGD